MRRQKAAEQISFQTSRDETPSLLCSFLFENFSEIGGVCPPAELLQRPPHFSPERFAERHKHAELLRGCVFSKSHPRPLKINTFALRFPLMITWLHPRRRERGEFPVKPLR